MRSCCGPRSDALDIASMGEPLLLLWSCLSAAGYGGLDGRHFPRGRGPLCHGMSASNLSYNGGSGPEAPGRPFAKIHGRLGTRMIFAQVPQLLWITGPGRQGSGVGRGAAVHQQRAAAGQQDGVELGAAEQ